MNGTSKRTNDAAHGANSRKTILHVLQANLKSSISSIPVLDLLALHRPSSRSRSAESNVLGFVRGFSCLEIIALETPTDPSVDTLGECPGGFTGWGKVRQELSNEVRLIVPFPRVDDLDSPFASVIHADSFGYRESGNSAGRGVLESFELGSDPVSNGVSTEWSCSSGMIKRSEKDER
jgi:hypothetical protein